MAAGLRDTLWHPATGCDVGQSLDLTSYRTAGWRSGALLSATILLAGCSALIGGAIDDFSSNLSAAVLDQDDPETVRAGAPAFLLLLDSLTLQQPDNPAVLAQAAGLYSAYGSVFVDDPVRARRLTARGFDYGQRALCSQNSDLCGMRSLPFEEFETQLAELRVADAEIAYDYSVSWLAWLRAHSDDWDALAELPKVESLLARLLALGTGYEEGNMNLYLGILNTLRPPSLGGKPELARMHFERAIELSDGRDLSAKVEFARGYARLLYDRELHDELLAEVVAAEPRTPGLTLLNVLAQQQAEALLASADDYF